MFNVLPLFCTSVRDSIIHVQRLTVLKSDLHLEECIRINDYVTDVILSSNELFSLMQNIEMQ